MTIGIYTQPLRLNYGGILQAWALQAVLSGKGYDVVTLDTGFARRLPSWQKPCRYGMRLARKLIGKGRRIFFEDAWNRSYAEASRDIQPFIERRIRRRIFRNLGEIGPDEFDVLLAGSDQVWRPLYNSKSPYSIEHSFFDFARDWNVKRVAYAASFGTDEWEFSPKQTRKCAVLAKIFAAVGVREESGVELCRKYLGIDAIQVPDPTLLLDRADYEALIEESGKTVKPDGDLLCYILDDTPQSAEFVRLSALRTGFKPFRVRMWRGHVEESAPQPSVEQWLRYFRDAKAVITDSFHACVFSVLFGKPFLLFGNAVRGMSRYESLLGELKMTDRLVTTVQEGLARLDKLSVFSESPVSTALAAMRKRAERFLRVLT